MSGSSSVTVPGTSGPVTVAFGTGDILHLASQIGALLSSIQGSSQLTISNGSFGSTIPAAPVVGPPTVNELIISGTVPGSATIPAGYNYVIDNNGTPTSITGSSLALITGTAGGSYNVSGLSTVAAEGGANLITATGQYLISTAVGNNTVSASGQGTVATDLGSNVIFVNGLNLVESIGQDTIVAGTGLTTVESSGSNSVIFGNPGGNSILTVSVSGAKTTVATFGSDATISVSGSQDLIFGGSGLTNVIATGSSDTLVGGSGAETVSGSGNNLLFGGSGVISFVGGVGTATIVGASGGTEHVTVGAGGLVFSAGAGNTSTITSGSGTTTVFGGAGSVVNFTGSLAGGILIGSAGNETLNAAGSSTSNVFSAGAGGNIAMIGGSGSETMFAGSGSDTLSGGAGSNIFAFFATATSGGQDYITDFTAGDAVYLVGYSSTGSASALQNAASVGSNGVTLTLSDSTRITFSNLTSASQLNGDILYAPKTT